MTAVATALTFAVESVEDWARDARELYREHWKELGLDLDLEISPAIDKMKAIEAAGCWKTITVRQDGELVGYLLALLSVHLHYSTSPPMFIVDAYYIKPAVRNGTGTKLLKFAEAIAKESGAIKIYLSCKVHEDHSALFERLGYRLSDYAFIKRI